MNERKNRNAMQNFILFNVNTGKKVNKILHNTSKEDINKKIMNKQKN